MLHTRPHACTHTHTHTDKLEHCDKKAKIKCVSTENAYCMHYECHFCPDFIRAEMTGKLLKQNPITLWWSVVNMKGDKN